MERIKVTATVGIKRMKYFDGLFLTEEEFDLDQKHHRFVRHLHNGAYLKNGIASGLEVRLAADGFTVEVSHGMVVVDSEVFIDEKGFPSWTGSANSGFKAGLEIVLPKELAIKPPEEDGKFYLYICRKEESVDIVQEKGGDNEIHWDERAVIAFDDAEAKPEDAKVLLAKVTVSKNGSQWKSAIDYTGRQYSGFSGYIVETDKLIVKEDAKVGGPLNVGGAGGGGDVFYVKGKTKVDGDLVVTGNCTIKGDIRDDIRTKDDIIELNSEEEVITEAGINISRNGDKSARLVWDEGSDRWKLGVDGNIMDIPYHADALKLQSGSNADSLHKHSKLFSPEGGAAAPSVEAVSVNVAGNVGIGTSAPQAKLSINGGLHVGGDSNPGDDNLLVDGKLTAGSVQLTTNGGIEFSDGTRQITAGSSGVSRNITQNGHGFNVGDAIFHKSAAEGYKKAQSNNEETLGLFVVSKKIDNNNFTLVQAGYVDGLSGLAPGEYHYVSADTAGKLVSAEPSSPNLSNPILYADTATSGYVLPFRPSMAGGMVESSGIPKAISIDPAAPAGALRIDGNGSVGIGTSVPKNRLDVEGGVAIGVNYAGDVAAPPNGLVVEGSVGIGTNTPSGCFEVSSPWNDWMFLRQKRNVGGGGGFHIHNPWRDSDTAERNRLEIAYRTSDGKDLWGQFVLHGPTGNVGIGTGNPQGKLDVAGVIKTQKLGLGDKFLLSGVGDGHANDDWLRLMKNDGSNYYGGFAAGRLWTAQGVLAGSDVRLKKDIKTLDGSLKKVLALRGVSFRWKENIDGDENGVGFIAQEVKKIFPETVVDGPKGIMSINYSGLIAPLVEAIKEQQQIISALMQEVKSLKDNKAR